MYRQFEGGYVEVLGPFQWGMPRTKQNCWAGFILYFSEKHYFHFKANAGRGTNNSGKFWALFYLLKLMVDRNLLTLQVYGDSLLVIQWMNAEVQVQDIGLYLIADQLKQITRSFQYISFHRVS